MTFGPNGEVARILIICQKVYLVDMGVANCSAVNTVKMTCGIVVVMIYCVLDGFATQG